MTVVAGGQGQGLGHSSGNKSGGHFGDVISAVLCKVWAPGRTRDIGKQGRPKNIAV
jgi:hypothetical protein